MLINRTAAISAARCSHCRIALLNAFASVASVALRSIPSPVTTRRWPTSRRAFQAPSAVYSELKPQGTDVPDNEVPVDDEPHKEAVVGPSEASVPWYLQVETPQRQISPLLDRQRLPELPQNPPALLQPILEHISVDLGLDDLTLFDLRKLDPPAALGANLIMIIGSARSEKHLHVSADRLCRWLRTSHKLSPYADGLLGRNELKLKMRRKARRAKLLGSVGSSESNDRDDGVRTGWVCVNIGTIEEVVEDTLEPEGFVGFGGHGAGVRVVVQMLTEKKREQLDLESLWGGILTRQEKKEAEDSKQRLEYQQDKEVGRNPLVTERPMSDVSFVATSSYQKSATTVQPQSRGMHTSARLYTLNQDIKELSDYEGLDSSSVEPRIQAPFGNSSSPLQNPGYSASPHQPGLDRAEHFSAVGNLLALRTRLNYLKSLPREDAIEVLGRGPQDYESTSFLVSFYGSFPLFPSAELWECQLDLHCYANEIRHPRYGTKNLLNQFKKMRASGVDISEAASVKLLRTILFCDFPEAHYGHDSTEAGNRVRDVSRHSIMRASYILRDMSLSGLNIVTKEIYEMLLEAVMLFRLSGDQGDSRKSKTVAALKRLTQIMHEQALNVNNAGSDLRILQMHANTYDWWEFWRYWHGIARRGRSKSEDLYALMYRSVASTKNQAKCMEVLRTWVPEMQIEEPPVKLEGAVAEAVMECVRVAEPHIEDDEGKRLNERGEWVRLWRQCLSSFGHTES